MYVTLRNVKEIFPQYSWHFTTLCYLFVQVRYVNTQIIWKLNHRNTAMALVCYISENDSIFKGLDITTKRRIIGFIKIICVKPKLVVCHVMCHLKNRKDNFSHKCHIQHRSCDNSDTTWHDHVSNLSFLSQALFGAWNHAECQD